MRGCHAADRNLALLGCARSAVRWSWAARTCASCATDADLDLAAKNIVKGGFSYSGQRCTAVKLARALAAILCCLTAVQYLWAARGVPNHGCIAAWHITCMHQILWRQT